MGDDCCELVVETCFSDDCCEAVCEGDCEALCDNGSNPLPAFCGLVAVVSIILFACSFGTLSATEMGIYCESSSPSPTRRLVLTPPTFRADNGITQTVSQETVGTGLHFLGVGSYFIKYPTTIQSMAFSTAQHDILHCRTNDGLPLILAVTYQYRISSKQGDLYKLYQKFPTDGQYYGIFFNTASHLIAESAT